MRLRKSRVAEADLTTIADFGLDYFGVERALAYIGAIETRCCELLVHPELGRAEQVIHSELRSLSIGSNRIYYSIDGDDLTLRRVLHKALDVGRWLG